MEEKRLCVITSHFNPAGYSIKKRNYDIFAQEIRSYGLPLVTVEASFNGTYEIEDAIHVKADSKLWLKENLLNIALKHLPSGCEYVAWIDADILFGNPDWVQETIAKLKTNSVVQLFEYVVRLPKLKSEVDTYTSKIVSGAILGGKEKDFDVLRGETGFAWAARRSLLEQHGFYENCIIGSGDAAWYYTIVGRPDLFLERIPLSPSHQLDYLDWARKIYNDVGGIDYVSGVISHLWHGEAHNRNYLNRHYILLDNNFNPRSDITKNQDGCIVWSNTNLEMQDAVEHYFLERKEDKEEKTADVASLLLMSYNRPENIEKILNEIVDYECLDEIIVFNNNPNERLGYHLATNKIKVINSSHDLGLRTRWLMAAMARNPKLIVQDDDIIVPQDTMKTMIASLVTDEDKIYSLHGRKLSPDGTYNLKNEYGKVPIILTRCAAFHRKFVPHILQSESAFFKNPKERWPSANTFPADDLFLSYAVKSKTNKLHHALDLPYTDIPDNIGISNRVGHIQKRTLICQQLDDFFGAGLDKP